MAIAIKTTVTIKILQEYTVIGVFAAFSSALSKPISLSLEKKDNIRRCTQQVAKIRGRTCGISNSNNDISLLSAVATLQVGQGKKTAQ